MNPSSGGSQFDQCKFVLFEVRYIWVRSSTTRHRRWLFQVPPSYRRFYSSLLESSWLSSPVDVVYNGRTKRIFEGTIPLTASLGILQPTAVVKRFVRGIISFYGDWNVCSSSQQPWSRRKIELGYAWTLRRPPCTSFLWPSMAKWNVIDRKIGCILHTKRRLRGHLWLIDQSNWVDWYLIADMIHF